MKRVGFILALALSVKIGFTQTPDLYWASFADYTGYDVAVDDMGNVYSMGIFGGTTDFDPGPGVFELTSSGDTDIFIQKLDSTGGFIWAGQLGGPGLDGLYISVVPTLVPGTVVIDPLGDIIITATFADSADVDPGPNEHILAYGNGGNSFVVKLDPNGNFIWGKGLHAITNRVEAVASAVDTYGAVYTTGRLTGRMDANPAELDSAILTSFGGSDFFVLKLDADGNYVWSGSFGNQYENLAYAISCSESDQIYLTGSSRGVVDFDLGPSVIELSSDSGFVFILKLGSDGAYRWVRNFPSGGAGYDIQLDVDENVYTLCSSGAGLDSDPGPDTVLLEGIGGGLQIHKMDSAGLYQWARHIYTESASNAWKFTLDACGYPWAMFSTYNQFLMDVDLDPGPNILNPPYEDGLLTFSLGLDSIGNFIWGGRLAGLTYGMGADSEGKIYYTGSGSEGDFDPSPDDAEFSAFNGFLVKMDVCDPLLVNVSYPRTDNVRIYPNPFIFKFSVSLAIHVEDIGAEVYDIHGRTIWTEQFQNRQVLDMALDVPQGIYFLRLELDGQPTTLKIIKQ